MSKIIKAPNTQKRLTNVVVVRLQKAGYRFEIACYPNKVEEWKQKIETDIDEVLQRQVVYLNVSKGQVAKSEDLMEAFNTSDQKKVCRIILESGQIQVSEKERKQDQDKHFKDIASLIAEKCINSETQQAFTVGVIENAMREIHISVNPHHSAKQQALKIIQLLQEKSNLPIERAKMKLQLTLPKEKVEEVKNKLGVCLENMVSQLEEANVMVFVVLIEPKNFREIDTVLKEVGGRSDVLQHAVRLGTEEDYQ